MKIGAQTETKAAMKKQPMQIIKVNSQGRPLVILRVRKKRAMWVVTPAAASAPPMTIINRVCTRVELPIQAASTLPMLS